MQKLEDEEEKGKKEAVKPASVLVNLNGSIVAIALAALGAGVFFKLGTNLVVTHVKPLISDFLDDAFSAGLDSIRADKIDIGIIIEKLAYPLIAVGLYALVMSGTGIFSAKLVLVPILIPYGILLGIGILFQLVLLVILGVRRQLLDGVMLPVLTDSIHQYRGYNETNPESQLWNIAMVVFQCCGAADFRDFQVARHWRRRLYQDGWWFELSTPLPCCILAGKAPDDFSCAVNPAPATSNYRRGCYGEVWNLLDGYKVFVIVIAGLLLVVQIVLFIACIILIVQTMKSRSGKKETKQSDSESKDSEVKEPAGPGKASGRPSERGGLASLAENLLGGFPGIPNPDFFQGYNNCRRNTSPHDLLTQLLFGQNQQGQNFQGRSYQQPSYYNNNNYDLPEYYDRSPHYNNHRGPVIVQLPGSPELTPVPKLHDRAMIAIEGPDTIPDSPAPERMHRQVTRCQSDGRLVLKDFDGSGKDAKLLRRDTYR